MKLTIGENIRNFRKKNDLTQDTFADRLGVTYQSVSRWENGITYPDLELIPVIAQTLSVTVDELLGMPQIEKEKRAEEAFDELRRECIKRDYDTVKIVDLLRDIRRNYLNSHSAWRPWVEGNDRAFRDPKVLPEVRLLAEAYLERRPMNPHVIRTMAEVEDEEHLSDFLEKHTTSFDCSARALLFNRYLRRGDAPRFKSERRYQLQNAIDHLLCPRYLLDFGASAQDNEAADEFMEKFLSVIRSDAVDDRPDMWISDRIELGFKSALRSIASDKHAEALAQIATVVKLLEDTMMITDKILLPTSCRFLDGMKWKAWEDWTDRDNNPDSPEERIIYMESAMDDMCTCNCIFPSNYYDTLNKKEFDPLRNHPEFEKLCERVKALIVTRPQKQ